MFGHIEISFLVELSKCGSPKHKVLEVGLLKGHVQLKGLSISPFGGIRLERSSLSLSTRVVGALDVSKNMLPRIWWVWEGHRVGVVAFANLACRKVMGTILLHQDGVLGMIALGFH